MGAGEWGMGGCHNRIINNFLLPTPNSHSPGVREWELGIGSWGLGAGEWELGTGGPQLAFHLYILVKSFIQSYVSFCILFLIYLLLDVCFIEWILPPIFHVASLDYCTILTRSSYIENMDVFACMFIMAGYFEANRPCQECKP